MSLSSSVTLNLIYSPLLFLLHSRVSSSFLFTPRHLFPFSLIAHFLCTVISAGSPSWSSSMTSMRHTCRRRSTSTGRRESQTPESTVAYTSSRRLDTGECALKPRPEQRNLARSCIPARRVCVQYSLQFWMESFELQKEKNSSKMFFKAVSFNLIYYLALQVLKSQH